MEKKLCEGKWTDYLHLENVHTWSELKELFIESFENDRNSKIWTHLYTYTQINMYEFDIVPGSRVKIDLLH